VRSRAAPDGTGQAGRKEQAGMIRRNIIRRSDHARDERLRRVIERADVA
jgi:hypothetical protein